MTAVGAATNATVEWPDRIRAAASAGTPLRIVGGGSKDFYGETATGERFETLVHTGIVDYDPTELVVTARCGTPIAELERILEGERQMLGFEPPRFASPTQDATGTGSGATVGGAVAAGLSGPRRPYSGAVRDSVLGLRIIDGRGESLSFGGRVMKNVAGFDVSRMITGSLGTLGVIAEVSLKCFPLPGSEATCVYELGAEDAIRKCNEWSARPLPISATCWCAGRLWVRFSGARPAVEAAVQRLGGEAAKEATAFWRSVRDQTHPFFAPTRARDLSLWRLSVRSTAPSLAHDGEQLVEWGGALRWLFASEANADSMRDWAQRAGGHATVFRSPRRTTGAFHPLAPAMSVLHRRLKAVFDPSGILNPGRMYPDL